MEMERNKIAVVFKVLGWLTFCGGCIAGFIVGANKRDFLIAPAMIVWASSFVSGMFFLGFGEIIQLLQDLFVVSRHSDITKLLQNIQKTIDKE